MKDQEQNKTELESLNIEIEKRVAEDFRKMAENTGIDFDDLVVTAMKRFRSSHADYMGIDLDYP